MKGYNNGKPMIKMLVDGGAAVNLMSYATYRKVGLGEEDMIQTDMMLKDFEGAVSPAKEAIWEQDILLSSSSVVKGHIVHSWAEIGSMPIVVYHLPCISALCSGSGILWRFAR